MHAKQQRYVSNGYRSDPIQRNDGNIPRLQKHLHTQRSELVCEFADRAFLRLLLAGESLGKFKTVTSALGLELDEITKPDAAVTPNSVRNDLSSIQELVQVRAAHPQPLRRLRRSKDGAIINND